MAETKDEIKKRLYKSIIIQSILKDIDDSYKNDILGGCIILIFCAVSTMAFLSTPKDHEEVTGRDFKGWVEKYLSSGEDQSYNYDPIDMWAARCGILHRYSPTSKYTDKKRAKKFTYNMSQNHVIKDSNT
ncbi:MAG: hypothetical protein KKH83_04820, partial [Candidatus Margulisbacteria bacterium]|nr:hypothetical protein [Candidatus Margulisiibacteriota bacterium]